MVKRLSVFGVVILMTIISFFTNTVMGQEQGEDNLSYTYGTVVKISPESVVISEYDFDSDALKEMNYAIDPKVELSNIKVLTEIATGDSVDLYYVKKDTQNIVKIIGKGEPLSDEEAEEPDESQDNNALEIQRGGASGALPGNAIINHVVTLNAVKN